MIRRQSLYHPLAFDSLFFNNPAGELTAIKRKFISALPFYHAGGSRVFYPEKCPAMREVHGAGLAKSAFLNDPVIFGLARPRQVAGAISLPVCISTYHSLAGDKFPYPV